MPNSPSTVPALFFGSKQTKNSPGTKISSLPSPKEIMLRPAELHFKKCSVPVPCLSFANVTGLNAKSITLHEKASVPAVKVAFFPTKVAFLLVSGKNPSSAEAAPAANAPSTSNASSARPIVLSLMVYLSCLGFQDRPRPCGDRDQARMALGEASSA